jgi:two-component system chemotaxis response regulator CheY
MREMVRSQLVSLGYGKQPDLIVQASDGQQAYQVLQEYFCRPQPVDLVLLDWEMPLMSGLELIKALRADERFMRLPVILLTAVNDHDHVVEAIQSGVTNYIVKPFNKGTLIEKLKKTWAIQQKKHTQN